MDKSYKLHTVNFHLVKSCNFKCKYCYARFWDVKKENFISSDNIYRILDMLKAERCKINFAGGEPFLHPKLGEFVKYASNIGLVTSIVTNGSKITSEWLDKYGKYLNIIAISCDSADEKTQKLLGRGKGSCVEKVINAFSLIDDFNQVNKWQIRKKLNSVITSYNYQEDMNAFIEKLNIERWKIFQVLRIKGENDEFFEELSISKQEFLQFVKRHKRLENQDVIVVTENNDAMTNSYIMIDPQGCFYQNVNNEYKKSGFVYELGIQNALKQVGFSHEKFINRGGLYK